jgi:predicted DCC family thiol-disulfide oxidoreductase YuxK
MARGRTRRYGVAMELRVLYDGACGLCSGSAAWLARRDRRGALRLVPLESPEAAPWRVHAGEAGGVPDTLVVVETGPDGAERVHLRSAAVARTLSALGPPWRAAGWLLARAPRPLADAVYRAAARRRTRARHASGCLRETHR